MNKERRKAGLNCLKMLGAWVISWIIGFVMLASGDSGLTVPATVLLVIGPYAGLVFLL
jgi:hypothetical protein